MPFVDIKPGDPAWEAVQRVGVMGIIKGFGKSIDWENKTFFYPDSTLSMGELKASLENVFGSPFKTGANNDASVTIATAASIVVNNQPFYFQRLSLIAPVRRLRLFLRCPHMERGIASRKF